VGLLSLRRGAIYPIHPFIQNRLSSRSRGPIDRTFDTKLVSRDRPQGHTIFRFRTCATSI
jgi:hypothetical protein